MDALSVVIRIDFLFHTEYIALLNRASVHAVLGTMTLKRCRPTSVYRQADGSLFALPAVADLS